MRDRRLELSECRQIVKEKCMSLAEVLLIVGTFGIMTGVWVTYITMIVMNKRAVRPVKSKCGCGGNCRCKK